jgi:hypothetical protein
MNNTAATKKAIKDMAPGFSAIAQRQINAENGFVEAVMNLSGLTREEAVRAMRTLLKLKVAKMDSVNGVINVKHGAFLDPEVLRRAAAV